MQAELVLTREAAGRLLELEAQGRPTFLHPTRVQARDRTRVFLQQTWVSPNEEEGGLEVPSVSEFLDHFDVIKVYSARGIRYLAREPGRMDRAWRGSFRRLLDTYGWTDPMPRLTACVIGLGRLGSKVAMALSEQGIGTLILVDPQRIERPNRQLALYRGVPLGTPKVEALQTFLGKEQKAMGIAKALWELDGEDWGWVLEADVIFVCVDNALARVLAVTRALQAGIPVIEGGVHIQRAGGRVRGLWGRIQTALPGFWCHFCIPDALDLDAASEELQEVAWYKDLPSPVRPADPTLSEWLAASMVLIFRQALLGQGIRPRYHLEVGGDGITPRFHAGEETVALSPHCPHCRPSPSEARTFVQPDFFAVEDSAGDLEGRSSWGGQKLERWILNGAAVGAWLMATVLACGLAFGLLLAVREMIGFHGPYGEGFPNPGEFLWNFGYWRYRHTAWNYFALLPSAGVFLALPYLLVAAPLYFSRRVYRGLGARCARGKGRRCLARPFWGLEGLSERWPASPPFRLPAGLRRPLNYLGQGLAALCEGAALLLLFVLFKSFGSQAWLALTFSALLPLFILFGMYFGLRGNHRALARLIVRLASPRN